MDNFDRIDDCTGNLMTSPLKILLLAMCAAAFVAYFGEKFMLLNDEVVGDGKLAVGQAGTNPVFAKTNSSYYGGDVYISMSRDGHYWVTIDVNGTPTRFVVDTGASHIALSYEDAQAAGLDPDALNYNRVFKTANGVSRKAIVTIDRMSLESIQINDITASVSLRGQLGVSLLGMNFLNRLSGFNVENNEMILKP